MQLSSSSIADYLQVFLLLQTCFKLSSYGFLSLIQLTDSFRITWVLSSFSERFIRISAFKCMPALQFFHPVIGKTDVFRFISEL